MQLVLALGVPDDALSCRRSDHDGRGRAGGGDGALAVGAATQECGAAEHQQGRRERALLHDGDLSVRASIRSLFGATDLPPTARRRLLSWDAMDHPAIADELRARIENDPWARGVEGRAPPACVARPGCAIDSPKPVTAACWPRSRTSRRA